MRPIFILLFLASTAFAEDNSPKFAVPSNADLESPRKIIEEVFYDSIVEARTFEEKLKLAAKILDIAEKTKDPSEQYALIEQVQDLALASQDLEIYFNTIDILTENFQVNPVELRVDMFTKFLGEKSDQATLQALAEIDATAATDPTKSREAAEAWYAMTKKLSGPLVLSAKERAEDYYQAALPQLTGLDKLQAQRRIQELNKDPRTTSKRKPNAQSDLRRLIGMWAVVSKTGKYTLWTFGKDGSVRCATWHTEGGTWAFESRSVKIVWGEGEQKWSRLQRPIMVEKTMGDDGENGPETLVLKKLDLTKLKIIDATYQAGDGKADVTQNFSKAIYSDGYICVDDRQMGADPAVGWRKNLVVTYSVNGKPQTITYNQFQTAIIGENLELTAR